MTEAPFATSTRAPITIRPFDAETPSAILIGGLGLSIPVNVLLIGKLLQIHGLAGDLASGTVAAHERFAAAAQSLNVLSWVGIAVMAITGIVFLVWKYKSFRRLHQLNIEGVRFTPGWVVGHYFIPIVGLVRPFQTMHELLVANETGRGMKRPEDRKRRAPGILSLWWLPWVISGPLSWQSGVRMAMAQEIGDFQVGVGLGVVSYGLMILSAIGLILVVRRVSTAQCRREAAAQLS